MRRLLPALALLLGSLSSALAAEKEQADERTIKFIESFVSIPVEQIPPDRVNDFMLVKHETLPPRLKEKALARKLELIVLKDLAENSRKGPMRLMEGNCRINDDAKTDDPRRLALAGFSEVSEAEETRIEEQTGCGQRDLMCEFSLQILLKKDKKGRPAGKRFFLHPNDPLMPLVFAARGESGDEPVYGKPSCTR